MAIFGLSRATKLSSETFRTSRQESEGVPVYELGNGQWNIPELRELLEKIIPEKSSFQDFRVEHDFPLIGHKVLVLNARRIEQRGSRPHLDPPYDGGYHQMKAGKLRDGFPHAEEKHRTGWSVELYSNKN